MAEKQEEARYSLTDVLTTEKGELRVGDVRCIIMTESAFTFLQQVIAEQAPELVKYGFYDMGYRAGRDLARTARRVADTPEEAFRFLVEIYQQSGYGEMEVVAFDLSKPEARLRGHNLMESTAAAKSGIYRTPRAVDHYSRGMVAGLFSELLGMEVVCEEMACEYRGDDACEFVVLPFGGGE